MSHGRELLALWRLYGAADEWLAAYDRAYAANPSLGAALPALREGNTDGGRVAVLGCSEDGEVAAPDVPSVERSEC